MEVVVLNTQYCCRAPRLPSSSSSFASKKGTRFFGGHASFRSKGNVLRSSVRIHLSRSTRSLAVKCVATLNPAVPLTAENVESVLDEIRSYLIADGGNVALHEIDGNVVLLKLRGPCGSCPSSVTTMKLDIERRLMEKIPEIVAVEIADEETGLELNEENIEKDSPSGAPQQQNKIIWRRNEKGAFDGIYSSVDRYSLVQNSRKRIFPQFDGFFHDTKVDVFMPKQTSLCVLMLHYTENGLFPQAQTTWEQLLYSSFVPSVEFISRLFDAYAKHGKFGEVVNILLYVEMRNFSILPKVYSLAISCFGREGQLELMEDMAKEMASRGVHISSKTANAFVLYYSIFGSLKDMENAYGRLKKSRFTTEREVIRAMASAYTRDRQFYEMGEFLRDVGLGRKDVGNLLWNLMLLSYAANFKMKSLQKEFLQMVESGFRPDITTFNIRALAFSRMALFWDLHLSVEHMEHENVIPDLVTFGCVVDAYLDRGLGRNLDFVLNKMNLDDSPMLLTDPFVYEALGKGDFQMSSEAFLEFKTQRKWTYRALIQNYLKKHYRRNQIFWNY